MTPPRGAHGRKRTRRSPARRAGGARGGRPRAAGDVGVHARPRRRVRRQARARPPRAHRGRRRRRAARCAFWLGADARCCAASPRAASGWFGRAQRLRRARTRRRVERGYLLLPASSSSRRAGELGGGRARPPPRRPRSRERFGDADLLALALHEQGHALVRAGPRRRGAARCSTRRWSPSRAGELSPIVTGLVYCGVIDGCQDALRAAARAGVDGGADALVRPAAGHGRVHRPVPGPPRRDHAARTARGRGARRGAAGARALPSAAPSRAAAEARVPPGRVHRCAASSRRPRRRTGRRAAAGASRSPGWRCCGWRRASAEAAAPRSGGRWTRPPSRCSARGCYPPPSRSCSRPATGGARAARARARARSRPTLRRRAARRDRRARPRRGRRSPRRRRAPRSPRCATPARAVARARARPTRRPASRDLVGLACRALGDEDAAGLELDAARRGVRARSAPARTAPARALARAAPARTA